MYVIQIYTNIYIYAYTYMCYTLRAACRYKQKCNNMRYDF